MSVVGCEKKFLISFLSEQNLTRHSEMIIKLMLNINQSMNNKVKMFTDKFSILLEKQNNYDQKRMNCNGE